jgi:hypothetical protein
VQQSKLRFMDWGPSQLGKVRYVNRAVAAVMSVRWNAAVQSVDDLLVYPTGLFTA